MLLASYITIFLPWDYVSSLPLEFFFFFLSFEIKFDVRCEAGIIFQFTILFKMQLFYPSKHGEMACKRLKRLEGKNLYILRQVGPVYITVDPQHYLVFYQKVESNVTPVV